MVQVIDRVFQILLTDKDAPPTLPFWGQVSVQSIRTQFPQARHCLVQDADIRSLIRNQFGSEVLWAYEELKPLAYRADLARYCLLYHYGGLYADIAVRFLGGFQPEEQIEFVGFQDVKSRTFWGINNGLIWCRRGYPPLREVIQQIVSHCREGVYGVDVTCPTGPALLGRVLTSRPPEHLCIGVMRDLTPDRPLRNRAYILDSGDIIALGKRSAGGDLSGMDFQGTNNYVQMWLEQDVYHQPRPHAQETRLAMQSQLQVQYRV